MSLSRAEARQLRSLSDALRACAGNPEATEHLAGFLTAWVSEHVSRPRGLDDMQMEMFAAGVPLDALREPVESSRYVDPTRTFEAPSGARSNSGHYPSATYPVESHPSSSADLDLLNKKQQRGRFTLDREEPFTPELAQVAEAVIAMRAPLKLPSPEYLWGKFCDMVVDEERTFVRRWNVKRAFQQFCEREWELKDGTSTPPPPPVSERRPVAKQRASSPPAAAARPRPAHRTDAALGAVLAMTTSTLRQAGAITAPPEPKSASA